MKKRLVILLSIVTLVSSIPVFADDAAIKKSFSEDTFNSYSVSSDDDKVFNDFTYEFNKDDKSVSITGYEGKAKEITIPAKIDTYPVTSIGGFLNCNTLEIVHIEDGISEISVEAFSNCQHLKEVYFPDSITKIGAYAFYHCRSLTKLTLNKNLEFIGEEAFCECVSLNEINFNNCTKLESIDDRAFADCKSITDLFFPDSIDYIYKNAFEGCNAIKNVKFSSRGATEAINESYLTTVYIPKYTNIDYFDLLNVQSELREIYYAGNEEEWTKFLNGEKKEEMYPIATVSFNCKAEDYLKKYDKNYPKKDSVSPDKPTTPEKTSTPSVNDVNAAVSANVTRGNATIGYKSSIAFPGSKLTIDSFGPITISYNGKEYKVRKVKVNKKLKKLQITKLTEKDKSAQKEIKSLTRGSNGLDFEVRAYTVSQNTPIQTKFGKNRSIKKLLVDLNGKAYKCKKTEYDYDPNTKTITFKGENLKGTIQLKQG